MMVNLVKARRHRPYGAHLKHSLYNSDAHSNGNTYDPYHLNINGSHTVHEDPDHTEVNLRKKQLGSNTFHTGARIYAKKKSRCHCRLGDVSCTCNKRRHRGGAGGHLSGAHGHGAFGAGGHSHGPFGSGHGAHSGINDADGNYGGDGNGNNGPANTAAKAAKRLNDYNDFVQAAAASNIPMSRVIPGANAALDNGVALQSLMQKFRESLPRADSPAAMAALGKAYAILNQAPNGDFYTQYVGPDGVRTGLTYEEMAHNLIRKYSSPDPAVNLEATENDIDAAAESALQNPEVVAKSDFNTLVNNGVPEKDAIKMANERAAHVQHNNDEHIDMANSLKESIAAAYEAANHRVLQAEVEHDKILDFAKHSAETNAELFKEHRFPLIHPIHLNETELAYLKGLKDVVPPEAIKQKVFETYHGALGSGNPPDVAMSQAIRTGYLISEYNKHLRQGVSPKEALQIVQDKAIRQNEVDQRRDFIQNSGPEIAQMLAEKTKLVQHAIAHVAKDPDNKDQILMEYDNHKKDLEINQSNALHKMATDQDIRKPERIAEALINQSQNIGNKMLDIAYEHPIVQKEIIAQGMEASADMAKEFKGHLDHVVEEENRHSPKPKSALTLLDQAKKEHQLDNLSRKNAETEKKILDGIIKEQKDSEVMATEENLAKKERIKKIIEQGRKAADEVLKKGGTKSEATAVKNLAEQALAKKIEKQEEAVRKDVLKYLSSSIDPKKAKQFANHVAIAHTGDNEIGKTTEEVLRKQKERRKREALENNLYADLSNENIDVVKTIPSDSTEVSVDNSVMSFPLNTFIDEKPRDKGEAYVKSRPEILRNLVRNTITKGKVDSGLNTLKTENGFYNIGENVEKVHIEDGFAYVKPSCKLSMEKAGIDTSEWKSKHNQGERKNIPNGQLYYEAKIKDAYLQLPTPLNKTPNSMISNANSQIDSSCIDEVNINKGSLLQKAWDDFTDDVHPKLNLIPDEDKKMEEISKLKHAMNQERKKEKLDGTTVYTQTNPDGTKHITTIPPYGVPESFEEEEGMKRLSNIDPDKTLAISETPIEATGEPIVNPLENVEEEKVLEAFINNTFAAGRAKNKAAKVVGSTNAFTESRDQAKADLIQAEDIEIEQHYRKDDSLAAKIKNDLIRKTKAYSNALNIESDEYINMINNIPDSTIYGMINYNNQTNKPATSLLDEGWSKSLSNIASTTSVSKLMNYMFNSISNVTGQPNNVSSVVVEKHLVPNLKGVKTTEINRRPNNVTLDITVEPPKPGTTILSRQVTAGTPTVRTGTDSSYRLNAPGTDSLSHSDGVVRNGSTNPLVRNTGPLTAEGGVRIVVPGNANGIVPPSTPSNTQPRGDGTSLNMNIPRGNPPNNLPSRRPPTNPTRAPRPSAPRLQNPGSTALPRPNGYTPTGGSTSPTGSQNPVRIASSAQK